ncbi:MAG TPA: M3 family metallopeptidase [Candidatus Coprenecus stercoravium]|uniref:M3 family metallopeptidase n=1 Tax=Candidatus Coprenecus stercoravium TaxID=2840735 RepID=A0A9D2K9E9_9BACT|nr:M3 family metallopeptidase [Candidatus Coprenecus stercoravium]
MRKTTIAAAAVTALMMTSCDNHNPLLEEWNTPFGIAPFQEIRTEHYKPAILKSIEEHNKEIEAIVNNPEAPTFENTIVALDNSGELFERIYAVFSNGSSINATPEIMALETELAPVVSDHFNSISMNEGLFARIRTLYDNRDSLGLEPDQMRLLTETYKSYERSGATLSEEKKEELRKVNSRISELQLRFEQNVLKETADFNLVVDNENGLSGLPKSAVDAAARRAEEKGMGGWWVFGLDNASLMPFLQFDDNRDLRTKLLDGYLSRGNNDNENDNKAIVAELVRLNNRKAKILGYDNYAQYVLEDRMAKTPEAVYDLLNRLWTPALNSAKVELADMAPLAEAQGVKELTAADWRYYFEKAKAEKFNFSEDDLRPYFQYDNVREGIFYVANRLYGITFEPLNNVPVPVPEAQAFLCKDADGSQLGVIFMDMFARPGLKRGGAWCTGYREQHYKDGERVLPIVSIAGNFTRGHGDTPALLSPDETETFFHEFGHALQSLLQQVRYVGNAPMTRDFVELPSQINEHWAFEPEVLKVYAKHYQTGEVIPQELVDKLDRSGKYGQGFATTEYLAASLLDMDYFIMNDVPENLDVNEFEASTLGERGLLPQIPPRYRSTYFTHVFGGGYTVGYYSYIWAELLDADAYQAFKETGDIFNQDVARRFRKEILEKGGEDDAMTLYLNFRGKEPSIDPLLENRGLK